MKNFDIDLFEIFYKINISINIFSPLAIYCFCPQDGFLALQMTEDGYQGQTDQQIVKGETLLLQYLHKQSEASHE